jgi:hypothetical protein
MDSPRLRPFGFLSAVLLALAAAPDDVHAQTVLVRVVDGESMAPSVGAIANLEHADGSLLRNALTDERGRALFIGVPAGTYRVRAEMIGMATAQTDLFEIADGVTINEEIRLESSAIQLEGIEVEMDAGRCSVRPGQEGLLVAQVWDEARKALSAASLTDQSGAYRYETVKYDRRLDRDGVILNEQQEKREGYMSTPFESRPAEDLADNGYVQRDGRDFVYFAPDAAVLLSDPFLDAHCFRMAGRNEAGLVGLGFEPTGDRKNVPDIAGTMWLDAETAELRWLEFEYQYLDPDMTSDMVGGRVDFERMPDGTWIVPEWWIRMPIMQTQTNFQRERTAFIGQYHQTGGLVLEAREAGGRSLGQRAQTGGVEGVVMDSVGVPLTGVRVGVVGSNQEVFSDREGKFSITGLTEGRYQVRFVDAQLEQAGFIPPAVPKDVIRGEMAYMEYHMPSMGDVLFEACRGVERPSDSVILAGTVVDGLGRVIPQATVRVVWRGYFMQGGGDANMTTAAPIAAGQSMRTSTARGGTGGLMEQTQGFEVTASSTGFFRFCGVPPGVTLDLIAQSGEDESELNQFMISEFSTGMLRVLQIER